MAVCLLRLGVRWGFVFFRELSPRGSEAHFLFDEFICSPAQEDEGGERDDDIFEAFDKLVNGGKEVVHTISFSA
ncbi:hypothetical protein SBA6_730006 [Candidatus Sulfopaludibacter sp. SbA6]|nr:hypothetical protein SBA6_730006 [Candidatus Sulfopaludibacter sp. SbA6]